MSQLKKQNNSLDKSLMKNRKIRVSKESIRNNRGRLKEIESSSHDSEQHNTGASQAGILCDDQSRREQLLGSKTPKGKVTCNYVPVVSSTGTPLMPCHQARARQLLKEKKAIKRFTNGIFYIKLTEREDGDIQTVACGIDPGSKREGFTVKSSEKTFINVLSETTGNVISKKLEVRRNSRKSRRFRKTPCRRNNRNKNRNIKLIPPSTRARWNAKLRIADIIRKIYPISDYVIEDVKAFAKEGDKKWNTSFSPLEIGKNYFYDKIRKIGKLTLMQGYETAAIRTELGLVKTDNKLADIFEAHNVDSWVLANSIFNIQKKPDNISIYKFVPIEVKRRQLFCFGFLKKGERRRYGGTVSLGIPKGTIFKYNGIYLKLGGNRGGRLSGHDIKTNKRVYANIKKEKIIILNYIIRWNVSFTKRML
jgi:hypothetical protein